MKKETALFEVKEVDRRFYAERLAAFLPDRIIDIHTHVWRAEDQPPQPPARDKRAVSWPSLVAAVNPIENLLETYRLMLPGKTVTPLIFSGLPAGGNLHRINAYIARCARTHRLPALIFSDPAWSAEVLERRVKAGGFLGAKSYLSMAPSYLPRQEIRITDFFPPHQLEVHDRNGWMVMLHIPRDGRLKDPVNLAQLVEIDKQYRRLKLVVAHVGRAYCDEDVGQAFEVLSGTRRLVFDFCANTNAHVFEMALRAVGPRRLLFGTDLPITRMRMDRVTRDGHYVNRVPRGLYGDVSGDPNMEAVSGPEADRLTFFMYEEIDAFRRAAERVKLSRRDVADVFAGNAARIIKSIRKDLNSCP